MRKELKYMENKNGMTISINGGQVNIARDSSTINAVQHNGENINELETIIKGIVDNLSELKKEDAEKIADAVDIVKEELEKENPKVSRLRNCVTLIAPMFTVANGVPILLDNLQRLVNFVNTYIH